MPLHTIGLRIPGGGRLGLTWGDYISVVLTILFYWQPGVDHQAVMQWIIDNGFYGSVAACSIAGTFVSHKLLEWGGMGFYALLYKYEGYKNAPGAATIRAAKIDQDTPWVWDQGQAAAEKHAALERKSIKYILLYHACVCVVQFLIWTSAIQWTWSKGGFQWEWIRGHPELSRADPALIPSKGTVAWQCLVSSFVAETGFYFAHRLLHETSLYYWHKRHHEYKDSTVYATFYVGLLDSVITDFIPAGFGIIYFEMHQWTVWMFTLPLILNALRVHCGYDNSRFLGFDPSVTLPLCTDAERTHDMHHRHNVGNYGGAYFIWDRLLGTYLCPEEELAARKAGRPFPPTKNQKKRFDGVAPADGEGVDKKNE